MDAPAFDEFCLEVKWLQYYQNIQIGFGLISKEVAESMDPRTWWYIDYSNLRERIN